MARFENYLALTDDRFENDRFVHLALPAIAQLSQCLAVFP
jgi:hypothetical protein